MTRPVKYGPVYTDDCCGGGGGGSGGGGDSGGVSEVESSADKADLTTAKSKRPTRKGVEDRVGITEAGKLNQCSKVSHFPTPSSKSRRGLNCPLTSVKTVPMNTPQSAVE